MKRILFTCGDMSIGGVQKSLVSLLRAIDFEKYEIFLMLNNISGELMDQLPSNVILIQAPEIISVPTFNKRRLFKDFKYLAKKPQKVANYFKSAKKVWKTGSKQAKEEFWRLEQQESRIQNKDHFFDVAISYAGGIGIWNYFVIESIFATKKICWFHGDYNKIGSRSEKERKNLISFDEIVVVSKTVRDSLIEHIPDLEKNITIIPNLIDKEFIISQSKLEVDLPKESTNVDFVSISRLDKEKGFDLALNAFFKAKQEGIKFHWIIVGDGNERKRLENQINKLQLYNDVKIVGFKSNPYPYLKNADVFFHPSKSEGFGLVVAEAKLLAKPILITNYKSVGEQIINGVNGVVVPITEEGILNGIKNISLDSDLRKKLASNLKEFNTDRTSIYKFDELLKI